MPMHDWTRVKAGVYHNFHFRWIAAIMDRLNAGLLPPDYFAMAEQFIKGPQTDVVTLTSGPQSRPTTESNGGVTVAPCRPKTRFVMPLPEAQRYARTANRVVVHHELGEVVAVIEIVSPGNKDRGHSLRTFVEKAVNLIDQQVNLLLVDPFPPGPHDPQGIHGAIWQEYADQPFELPPDKPLTVAAYQVKPAPISYVEAIAVGDPLPDMPVFLFEEYGVQLPLEETYQTTWNVLPSSIRRLLEPTAPS